MVLHLHMQLIKLFCILLLFVCVIAEIWSTDCDRQLCNTVSDVKWKLFIFDVPGTSVDISESFQNVVACYMLFASRFRQSCARTLVCSVHVFSNSTLVLPVRLHCVRKKVDP